MAILVDRVNLNFRVGAQIDVSDICKIFIFLNLNGGVRIPRLKSAMKNQPSSPVGACSLHMNPQILDSFFSHRTRNCYGLKPCRCLLTIPEFKPNGQSKLTPTPRSSHPPGSPPSPCAPPQSHQDDTYCQQEAAACHPPPTRATWQKACS